MHTLLARKTVGAATRVGLRADTSYFIAKAIAGGGTFTGAQIMAVDQFIARLNGVADASYPTAYNLTSKLYCVHPFVGGAAGAHLLNALNPDTRPLVFVGSPTHNSTGASFVNGTSYFKTGVTLSTAAIDYAGQMIYYGNNRAASSGHDIGTYTGATEALLQIRFTGNVLYTQLNCATNQYKQVNSVTDTTGMWFHQRISDVNTNACKVYKRGVSQAFAGGTMTTISRCSFELYGACANNGTVTPSYPGSNMSVRGHAIANAVLSDNEHQYFYNIFQDLKTAFGQNA